MLKEHVIIEAEKLSNGKQHLALSKKVHDRALQEHVGGIEAVLFGVFDGHGEQGKDASKIVAMALPKILARVLQSEVGLQRVPSVVVLRSTLAAGAWKPLFGVFHPPFTTNTGTTATIVPPAYLKPSRQTFIVLSMLKARTASMEQVEEIQQHIKPLPCMASWCRCLSASCVLCNHLHATKGSQLLHKNTNSFQCTLSPLAPTA